MTPDDFAQRIRQSVVEENASIYLALYASTERQAVTDDYWSRALELHDALEPSQRQVLVEIIRQTMVDTVSNVLGILDGTSPMGDVPGDFVLTTTTNTERLNGNLQDLFLELEERRNA